MDAQDRAMTAVRPAGAVPPGTTQTLWTVQVLRGVAALMVVIGHSQSAVAAVIDAIGGAFARSAIVPWGAGVDLFFVISGFIMVHASGRLFGRTGARREFLRRRLVRIVPLYWLATTLFLLLLAAATLKGGDPFPGSITIVASYAFIPVDSHGDGRLFPVFDLGWTLNYEMFFYALLALLIPLPRRYALTVLTVLLVLIAAAGTFIPGPSTLWFWTRPIILDFALGLLVGALCAGRVTLPRGLRFVLAATGLALLLADPFHMFNGPLGSTVANEWPRVLFAGVPLAILLAAAVLGPEPNMPRYAMPLTRIGDASYSLYLFHPVALIAMEKCAQKSPLVRTAPGWALVAGTVVVAIGLAIVVHRLIERPMTAALSRRVAPRPLATRTSFATN